jgi:hypothetical protein
MKGMVDNLRALGETVTLFLTFDRDPKNMYIT